MNNANLLLEDYVWVHFSSVDQSCLTLCDPMDCSMPGLRVYHVWVTKEHSFC